VFGETTAQIAHRLDRCARGAQVLIVQGGINDVYRSIPVERSAANLRAMVRRGRRLGLRVALTDVLPWNNGYPRYAAKIDRLNALIARVGRDEHVPVLPFFQTLEDPQRPGRMRAELTADGDHPSVAGYRLLGERAFSLP
jgi:lysophospholipase L1-like esterase